MSQRTKHCEQDRRSAWTTAVVLLLVAMVYVLSYAPVVRVMGGSGAPVTGVPIDGNELPVYRPVDWLIDHTPMREPLFWWADVCGVGPQFRAASWWR